MALFSSFFGWHSTALPRIMGKMRWRLLRKTCRVTKRHGLKEDWMDWMFDYHNVKV
jgi:hypothetical protein